MGGRWRRVRFRVLVPCFELQCSGEDMELSTQAGGGGVQGLLASDDLRSNAGPGLAPGQEPQAVGVRCLLSLQSRTLSFLSLGCARPGGPEGQP